MPESPKPRILIVDDDQHAAHLMAEAMELMGYDATAAYDYKYALTVAHDYRPHVVLIDLVMSDLNGFQFATALRQSVATAEIPLIAFVAAADSLARHQAIRSGFDRLIVKPAQFHQVIDAIEELLRFTALP